jgi:chaperonin GroES
MKPTKDRVIIKPDTQEEVTKGGIIIPTGQTEMPHIGTIVAVGTDKEGNELTINEGDRILFNRYSGVEFEEEGNTYKVLKYDDILLVLDPDTEDTVKWVQSATY